jgi:hypothetical protein
VKKQHRRLRRLVPDHDLFRRRAAGEPLRSLAVDYAVTHTTLGRFFARPEIAKQLKEARRLVRRERQRAAAREAEERRLEREVHMEAKRQVALEQERRAARASIAASQPRRRMSLHEAWLDQRDARQPPTRADLRTGADELAARAVASGGGVQAVIEATGLRTRGNALRLIDPSILVGALENDATARAAELPRDRLRRLIADDDLIRRRAVAEPLRRIAADYRVHHTTLLRYFQRPKVARQIAETRRRLRS